MLSACGKNNEYTENMILTGVYDARMSEAGSGLNNVIVYSVTDRYF